MDPCVLCLRQSCTYCEAEWSSPEETGPSTLPLWGWWAWKRVRKHHDYGQITSSTLILGWRFTRYKNVTWQQQDKAGHVWEWELCVSLQWSFINKTKQNKIDTSTTSQSTVLCVGRENEHVSPLEEKTQGYEEGDTSSDVRFKQISTQRHWSAH